jgi:RNA polymerase sigma-70 factor, ECF subfamily
MVTNRGRGSPDEELIRRGRAGEREALGELFERYEVELYGFVRRFLRGAAEASDVYQEIVLKIIENLDRFNPKLNFRTWMYTLAANHCKNVLRSKERRKRFQAQPVRRYGEDDEIDLIERAPNGSPAPDRKVEDEEFIEALEGELANLPAPQREVFILRAFNNVSFKDISMILRIPEATARSRMFLAVEYLRVRLREFSASAARARGGVHRG